MTFGCPRVPPLMLVNGRSQYQARDCNGRCACFVNIFFCWVEGNRTRGIGTRDHRSISIWDQRSIVPGVAELEPRTASSTGIARTPSVDNRLIVARASSLGIVGSSSSGVARPSLPRLHKPMFPASPAVAAATHELRLARASTDASPIQRPTVT